MAPPSTPRLRVLSVGGNPLSAFLSWRLQATHSCDVTLVWKTAFDAVSQYGISFKSSKFGNERFKPYAVVRTPEEAGTMPGGFDYVLLSVKALPDVYDLASIIESVVTPQHTCILVNTTTALGTEVYLESRYPTNVVLSLVSGVSLNQVGTSEFEHTGNTDVWVGSAITNENVDESMQFDMAEALSLTLASGGVDCHVSPNIKQQQWERVLGPIAFHPLSVIMDCPDLPRLMEKPGCKTLIHDLIGELISIAEAQGCQFPPDFAQKTIDEHLKASPNLNIMHQDYTARRPLEIETFLGSPIKAGKAASLKTPRLDTLYPILHHLNQQNQNRPPPSPSGPMNPSPRAIQSPPMSRPGTQNGHYPMGNGMPPRRPPTGSRPGLDPRRPPGPAGPPPRGSSANGHPPPRANGMNGGPQNGVSRRNSFDDDLEEFGHIALYGDMVEDPTGVPQGEHGPRQLNELALRERELALREREYALQQQQQQQGPKNGGRKMPGRRKLMSRSRSVYGDDEDDDDDFYVDEAPAMPVVDVENFDMMSLTSRRNRRLPSAGNIRNNPEAAFNQQAMRGGRHSMFTRPGMGRQRTSARMMSDVPGLHDSIVDNPLMGYSSNRYGAVDRKVITDTSRANSMTSTRMEDIRNDPSFGNAYPQPPNNRRMSQFPAEPQHRGPPADLRAFRGHPDGPPQMRYSPGPNGYPPHPTEQPISDGVSHPRSMKGPPNNNVRSTTGSASASTNDSASGDTSAHSSSSSLEKRTPGVTVR